MLVVLPELSKINRLKTNFLNFGVKVYVMSVLLTEVKGV